MKTKGDISYCSELVELIKGHMNSLFDEYQFKICAISEFRSGDNCMVVIESPSFRIRFQQERNHLKVSAGDKDAHLKWGRTEDDKGIWHHIIYTVDYINNRPRRTYEEISELSHKLFGDSVDEKIARFAELLISNIDSITAIFEGSSKEYSLQELSDYVWENRQEN